ncbi:MAG: methyltransferase [Chitinophagales bacterium]|nr:methyltransferase [Chitinophagaceae bacterium]MCB9064617.1 methyltransferase [Chitinophagales bacterium]
MSNSYFKFKQFTIFQDKCAMKVSTDACIHGAWTPVTEQAAKVLDIGTGTGLLSLMLLQRNNKMTVDAIEIDADAAEQAASNVKESTWQENINIVCSDIRTYPFIHKYDLIICNPPFFNKSLEGPNAQRNVARHTSALTYDDLLSVVSDNLIESGVASVLLPAKEFQEFEPLLNEYGLYITGQLSIHPREGAKANRVVALLSNKRQDKVLQESLNIRQANSDEYTQEFIELLQPYYLSL